MNPFLNLLGNERAKYGLQQMLAQNSLANTLLFYGPEGVGKRLFADALARHLLGEGEHGAHHPDLHILTPDEASALHPIESIRACIEEVNKPPFVAHCKIFIIEDAHQMLPTSSNALLKTLEEPILDTYIILLTDQMEMILPTILSRCRKVPFVPVSQECIQTHLMTRGQSEDRAIELARLSFGSFARADLLVLSNYQHKSALIQQLCSCILPCDYPRFSKICLELEKECEEEEGESKWKKMDSIFEQILWEHLAMYRLPDTTISLEQLFEQIEEGRLAVRRHIKLRVVLEELLFN